MRRAMNMLTAAWVLGWRASTPPGAPECWCLWRCIPQWWSSPPGRGTANPAGPPRPGGAAGWCKAWPWRGGACTRTTLASGRSWRGTARLFIMCWPAMIYWRLAAPAVLCCWMAWRACLPSHSATFCCVPSCCGRHCTAGGPIMRDAKAARWKPPLV